MRLRAFAEMTRKSLPADERVAQGRFPEGPLPLRQIFHFTSCAACRQTAAAAAGELRGVRGKR